MLGRDPRNNHSDDVPPDPDLDAESTGEDETEGADSPTLCTFCRAEIVDRFYVAEGRILCEPCREKLGVALGPLPGGAGRFARAILFGLLAGLGGFLIYYGVLALFDLQVGLIAILVGFMVGGAVAKGSRHRGGWVYQLLAVFLTYSVVAASFSAAILPGAIAGFKERSELERAEKDAAKPDAAKAEADPAPAPAAPATPLELVRAVFLLLGLMLALVYSFPIIAGLNSPVSFLILGFALWEAWKLNRKPKVAFQGPFEVEATPDGAAA